MFINLLKRGMPESTGVDVVSITPPSAYRTGGEFELLDFNEVCVLDSLGVDLAVK